MNNIIAVYEPVPRIHTHCTSPFLIMPALDQYDAAYSAGSSTRVSAEGIQTPSSPLVHPPQAAHFSSYFTPQPSDIERHKQVLSPRAPSVSESERERIEREDAVSAVSPRGEVAGIPLDEALVEKEKEDPFLVVWDEGDQANPKARLFPTGRQGLIRSDHIPLDLVKAISVVPVRQFLNFIGFGPDRFASSTFVSSLLILNASFSSSAPSGVALPIAVEFGLSQIETTLAISLFIGEPLRSSLDHVNIDV